MKAVGLMCAVALLAAPVFAADPPGIPHSFLVPSGKHMTYVLLKIPAS